MVRPEQFIDHQSSLPQEKCGITAIVSKHHGPISPEIPRHQYRLHHRGRDANGIAVFDRSTGEIKTYKGDGSTGEVFGITKNENGSLSMAFDFASHGLLSDVGIGHNRYGTSGADHKDASDGAQPMEAEWNGRKVAISFNGNLPDSERHKLRAKIPLEIEKGHFDTNDIAQAIVSAPGDTWEERIVSAMDGVGGAYSLAILADGDVYGLRGPSGTWPLWRGENEEKYVLSSESIVDPSLDWTEVNPGELIKISQRGLERRQVFTPAEARCTLHDVYGAHPDSLMSGAETYRSFRERVGSQLAKEHPVMADIYLGVPNSGVDIAVGYTRELGVPLTNIFRVLDGAERSYIAKNKEAAEHVIKNKIVIREDVLESGLLVGKSLVVKDDSTIKGSTLRTINSLLRKAGAAKITNILGTHNYSDNCDLGYVILKDLLVSLEKAQDGTYRQRNNEEIAELLQADAVHFISKEGLRLVYGEKHHACMACMGGEHPLHGVSTQLRQVFSREDRVDNVSVIGTMREVISDHYEL